MVCTVVCEGSYVPLRRCFRSMLLLHHHARVCGCLWLFLSKERQFQFSILREPQSRTTDAIYQNYMMTEGGILDCVFSFFYTVLETSFLFITSGQRNSRVSLISLVLIEFPVELRHLTSRQKRAIIQQGVEKVLGNCVVIGSDHSTEK